MKTLGIVLAALAAIVIGFVAFGGWFFGTQFYMRGNHATLTAADLERKFTPDELKGDVAAMLAIMDRVHPNLYAYTPQEQIAARAAEISMSLTAPMTRMEFYRALAPLNASSSTDIRRSLSPMRNGRRFAIAMAGSSRWTSSSPINGFS